MNTNAPRKAGDLDPGFGKEGQVELHDEGIIFSSSHVMPGGSLLSIGSGGLGRLAVMRHRPDGSPDNEFGDNGIVRSSLGTTEPYRMIDYSVEADGRCMIAGELGDRDLATRLGYVRLTADGYPDRSFGEDGNGLVIVDLRNTGMDMAGGIAIQEDGKVVAAAAALYGFDNRDNLVLRLTQDGSLDDGFGSGGLSYEFPPKTHLWKVALLPGSQKLLLSGGSSLTGMFSRYLTNGNADESFGDRGHFRLEIPGWSGNEITSFAVQPDGKLLIVGSAWGSAVQTSWIARLSADGSRLDSTFHGGEPRFFSTGRSGNAETDVLVQSDGKIVSLGTTFGGAGDSTFTLARFQPDGTPDLSFGDRGLVFADPWQGTFRLMRRVQMDGEGHYVVSGRVVLGSHTGIICRFLSR